MPSQARAIPLVTVSLAHGHVRQTRRNQSRTTTLLRTSFADQEQHTPSDLPPAYDTLHSSTSSNGQDHNHDSNQQQQQQDSNSSSGNCPRQQHHQQQHQQLVTASPSDADVTDAVLHLSRTLVSNTAKANDSQSKSSLSSTPSSSSSWVYMMLYSWTQTAQTATRLFHILTTQPSNLLKEIQGQNEQALLSQQRRQPRKSIQQLTEEEDRMEDDPDMINGTATEMVSVSMMNTRTVAGMAESLSEQDTEMQDRPGIRKIEQYQNPFAPAIAGTDEQEDDEGWLGRGDLRSESGATKSNSVRLTSTKLTVERALPNFNHRPSSLGAAMDPHQFETRDRDSILLDYEPSSRPLRTSLSTPSSIFNTSTGNSKRTINYCLAFCDCRYFCSSITNKIFFVRDGDWNRNRISTLD
ncbi:hypothetical protein BGZ83_007008 [Gryganskiella cystojenkinii]|nr:hypothetical protein BGZ83_007008 [Gryganskiella cystojenkinii]